MRWRWLVGALVLAGCGSNEEMLASSTGSSDTSSTAATTTAGATDSTSGPGTTTGAGSSGATSDSTSAGVHGETDGGTTGGSSDALCEELLVFIDDLQEADQSARPQMLDDYLRAATYSEHGLPLRCDGRLGFVAALDDSVTYSVAGAFNDWDPEATPLLRPVDSAGLFYAFVDFDMSASGQAYKFVRGGSDFFADPGARRYDWDEFGEFSLTAARATTSHHERWPTFTEGIGDLQPRSVTVWVPPNADAGGPLPVLYMHDGQNVFDPASSFGGWQASTTALAQIEAGSIEPVYIVAVDNTPDRMDEYSHTTGNWGGDLVGGRGDEYTDFLVGGLKPFVDARYATRPGRESTGIMGASMGGLISLYAAWLHPEVYGFAASMSGTVGWGGSGGNGELIAELYATSPPSELTIYLDSGGSGPCPNEGTDNYCETIEMRDTLLGQGWTQDIDLFHAWAPDAPHNEASWAARLSGAMSVWLGAD